LVASFGRRPEPEPEPEPAAFAPVLQVPLIPVLDPDALEQAADEIRMSVAEAVMRGFQDGMAAWRETSAEASVEAADG
jgi:hypothetical protein